MIFKSKGSLRRFLEDELQNVSFIRVVHSCTHVVCSRVIIAHIMWMRKRLESRDSHRLDSCLHGTPSQECLRCASGALIVARVGRIGGMEVCGRLLGRPPRCTGTETELPDWSFEVGAYFDTVSQRMADHIDAVEAHVDREVFLSSVNDVAIENSRKMFYALTMPPQGPLLLLLKNVERGQRFRGLEATGGAIRRSQRESIA